MVNIFLAISFLAFTGVRCDERCLHGTWNPTSRHCNCNAGWRVSGPTDTLSFLQGVCEQSLCESDSKCNSDLEGILDYGDTATCNIQGWNCNCGWKYAFGQSWTGSESESAKCMGVLYTLSVSGTDAMLDYMRSAWKLFVVLAVLFLPFGQMAVRCQHRNPDIFKMAHSVGFHGFFDWDYDCDGRCIEGGGQGWMNNLAWSLYIIDLGVWTYAFAFVLWCVFLVSWSIMVWLMMLVIMIAVAIATLVAGACACAGDGGSSDCSCCGSCEGHHWCECNGGCDNGGGCCDGWTNTDELIWYNTSTDFYHGGPSPDGRGCCHSHVTYCHLWRPVAWLLHKFPVAPANLWGGVFGYVIGTHPSSPCPYQGNSWCINRLSFRTSRDLRSNSEWRERVQRYIFSFSNPDPNGSPARHLVTNAPTQPLLQASRTCIASGTRFIQTDRPFDKEHDRIVSSSFDDYQKNECWICCGANERVAPDSENNQWHLWTQCGHLFCAQCSNEMLRRKMPCPLCRRASSSIKQGPKPLPRLMIGSPERGAKNKVATAES